MAIRWTKMRNSLTGLFTITLLVAFIAVAAALLGYRLPVLSALTDAVGIGAQQSR